MSNKIYFMNDGEFDVRAMLTMGLSAKKENSIGYFGTGFKYAIAIILRLGGGIKISTTSGVYEFTARNETVRDKQFDIVYMNGTPAGFTTHLGANWEPWMAYRELRCNATDEDGAFGREMRTDFDTIIEVDCAEVYAAHTNQHMYFLSTQPLAIGNTIEFHPPGAPYVYYKGIAVRDAEEMAKFSYNLTHNSVSLTEDRTLKYPGMDFNSHVCNAMKRLTDKTLLHRILRAGSHWEGNLALGYASDCTTEFLEVCNELLRSELGLCEAGLKLLEQRKDQNGEWPEFTPSPVQQKMLTKAKSFLSHLDIDVDRYPVKTVTGLGSGIMGRAKNNTIYITELAFNMGTKQVASTLLEEWVHNRYGCDDFDRQMQSWLFDKILTLGENIVGEPV